MRIDLIVLPICSGEIVRRQRSRVQQCEHAFQRLDFGNGLLIVHAGQFVAQERHLPAPERGSGAVMPVTPKGLRAYVGALLPLIVRASYTLR